MTITADSAWTVEAVIAAARPLAALRGLAGRVYIEHSGGATAVTAVRIEFLRGDSVTCWTAIDIEDLEACPDVPAVTELVERRACEVLRMRHGAGAAA